MEWRKQNGENTQTLHTTQRASIPHSTVHLPPSNKGFSLIEMLVTVSIFAIISSIVIVRNSQFDDETLLHNLAYDIALSVRQAQQFGVNVRGGEGDFDQAYGVHFDADSDVYQFFRDSNGNGAYDSESELLETYTIGRGARIGTICNLNDDRSSCGVQESLDVVFRRPNPDAVINNDTISRASVELISARQGGRRLVVIYSTGQISIERPEDE